MKHRTLMIGSRGPDVRDLQTGLAQRRHDPGPVDGVFGELTETAVRNFQRSVGISVDGTVGPATRAALAACPPPAPPPPPPAALDDGTLPDATRSLWIHRLAEAIERAGGTVADLVRDLQELETGLVIIKVLDGRSLMNQARLGEVVAALHAAGIRVALWAWVWAVYYDAESGLPATPYHATVEYVEEQARLLAEQARRYGCSAIVYANIEGEGAWSTAPGGTWGQRNIRTFGARAAADRAIAERADAYAQALEASMPGALRVCSTHGLSATQRLPWPQLCKGFDVLAPQWYSPGSKGYDDRLPTSVGDWRRHGARRIRASGPAWRTQASGTKPAWIGQLVRELRVLAGVDRGADWWVYELMTKEHRAALLDPR